MGSFLIYFFLCLCAAGFLLSILLFISLGEPWMIFGLIFCASTLAGLLALWKKLDRVEKKLDQLLTRQDREEP